MGGLGLDALTRVQRSWMHLIFVMPCFCLKLRMLVGIIWICYLVLESKLSRTVPADLLAGASNLFMAIAWFNCSKFFSRDHIKNTCTFTRWCRFLLRIFRSMLFSHITLFSLPMHGFKESLNFLSSQTQFQRFCWDFAVSLLVLPRCPSVFPRRFETGQFLLLCAVWYA